VAEDLSGFSMLELFRLEAESQTAILSAGVLAVEEFERSPETIESMMRAAHSLKGAARIVGLDPAVRVAHAMEDCFVAAGKGTFRVRPEHVDLLLASIDFLSSIAKADDAISPKSDWPRTADALVAELGALLTAPASQATPPVAPPAANTEPAATEEIAAPEPPARQPAPPTHPPLPHPRPGRSSRPTASSAFPPTASPGSWGSPANRSWRPASCGRSSTRCSRCGPRKWISATRSRRPKSDSNPMMPRCRRPCSACWPACASVPTPALRA
jgi:two-component system sensor histidine kinase and response regulator WspE